MNPIATKLAASALLGASLLACNQTSVPLAVPEAPAASPAAVSDFDRTALAIKSSDRPLAEKVAALETLVSRPGKTAAEAGTWFIPSEEAGQPLRPVPLAKTAIVDRYYTMKHQAFGNEDYVLMLTVLVKVNQTLRAVTSRDPGSTADPFIVATYNPGNTNATRVVGLNDDYNGLDSRITWKNTSGADRLVQIIAFAYTPALSGNATLISSVSGVDLRSDSGPMGGAARFDNNGMTLPIAGCSDPRGEQLSIQEIFAGGTNAAAMMVNAESMTGADISLFSQGETSFYYSRPTPSGYPSFLLGYARRKPGDKTGGLYLVRQENRFDCNN